MTIKALDIETESLDPEKIWYAVAKNVGTEELEVHFNLHESNSFKDDATRYVIHNGLGFDVPVINKVAKDLEIDPQKVIDTLVVSRLVNFYREGGHSLEVFGEKYNFPKSTFDDYSKPSQELLERCLTDVDLLIKIYEEFKSVIFDPKWRKALRLEHDTAIICRDIHDNGFWFDWDKSEEYLEELNEDIQRLEKEFQVCFPPHLVVDRVIKHRINLDNSLNKRCQDAIDNVPMYKIQGDKIILYDYEVFDPASPKMRIDRLWEAGWKPLIKTKGHSKFLREKPPSNSEDLEKYTKRKERFEKYGWECSEENLKTLPKNAPLGAHKLAEFLTLQGRKLALTTWREAYNQKTHRIHGEFYHIGTWTGRKSHARPNMGNVPVAFSGEAITLADKVKEKYNNKLRALYGVPKGHYLVGTDAEGIQLRVLAHYLNNEEFTKALEEGRKEDETDIHNLNKKALGSVCQTRDDAKTFIYAFILNAGLEKMSLILSCSVDEARKAEQRFYNSIKGLRYLKEKKLAALTAKGGFLGLDNRFVICNSYHKMLAGLLQNGESVIMKWANRLWRKWLEEEGIWFKQVNDVHDEWQTEVKSLEDAKRVGELQCKAIEQAGIDLNLRCKLAGSTKIGLNWAETH